MNPHNNPNFSTATLKTIRLLQSIVQKTSSTNRDNRDNRDNRGVWLVGGTVRDIIMGNNGHDVDIITEMDACVLSEEYGKIMPNATVRQYKKYRTASISYNDGNNTRKIDITTPRTETFLTSGGQPQITIMPTIEHDLPRRDFNINAMALNIPTQTLDTLIATGTQTTTEHITEHLAEHLAEHLLDPFNGLDAIRNKTIAVLHDQSFTDDPSRILRCLRFAARYNLTPTHHTVTLMHNAKTTLANLNANRTPYEMAKLMDENSLPQIITLAHTLGIDIFSIMFNTQTAQTNLASEIRHVDEQFANTTNTANKRYALRVHTLTQHAQTTQQHNIVTLALQGKPHSTQKHIKRYLEKLAQGETV